MLDGLEKFVKSFLLSLDAIVYNLISWFYDIFLFLANDLNVFTNEDYADIVKRIYIILGIVMLFVLSYSLLRAVISPDEYSKGDKSPVNIIKNVLISLVIIAVLPTVFDIATRVQGTILKQDVIGKIIIDGATESDDAIKNGGKTIAVHVYQAFLYPTSFSSESGSVSEGESALAVINEDILADETSFFAFNGEYKGYDVPQLIVDDEITYLYIVPIIAGGFVLWCILLFCFDLAIRVIKLIYYQIIAPVAVVCRVLPGNKGKSVFSNWLKYTINTYLEVFIRIFVMYLGVFIITLLVDKFPDILSLGQNSGLDVVQRLLVQAFLIMGVIAFIRQAPKLLQNVFGFETGGLNLGLKGLSSRLSEGGFYAARNAITTTPKALARRARHAFNSYKETKGQKPLRRVMNGVGGTFSTIFGSIGAGFSSFSGGFNAKNGKEAKEAQEKTLQNMANKQAERDKYWAKHGNTLGGVIMGRAQDSIHSFMGLDVAAYDRKIGEANSVVKANDDYRSEIESFIKKYFTSSSIVSKMVDEKGKTTFKGGNASELAAIYENEFSGQSLATIQREIERRKEEVSHRDYDALAREQKIKELMDKDQSLTRQDAISKIDSDEIKKLSQQMAMADSNRVANLDSMYNQLYKATVTNVGNIVSELMQPDGTVKDFGDLEKGGIAGKEFFKIAKQQKIAEATFEKSTIEFVDPSTGKRLDANKNKPGQFAEFMDDAASVAKNVEFDLNSKKQQYIEKNSTDKK